MYRPRIVGAKNVANIAQLRQNEVPEQPAQRQQVPAAVALERRGPVNALNANRALVPQLAAANPNPNPAPLDPDPIIASAIELRRLVAAANPLLIQGAEYQRNLTVLCERVLHHASQQPQAPLTWAKAQEMTHSLMTAIQNHPGYDLDMKAAITQAIVPLNRAMVRLGEVGLPGLSDKPQAMHEVRKALMQAMDPIATTVDKRVYEQFTRIGNFETRNTQHNRAFKERVLKSNGYQPFPTTQQLRMILSQAFDGMLDGKNPAAETGRVVAQLQRPEDVQRSFLTYRGYGHDVWEHAYSLTALRNVAQAMGRRFPLQGRHAQAVQRRINVLIDEATERQVDVNNCARAILATGNGKTRNQHQIADLIRDALRISPADQARWVNAIRESRVAAPTATPQELLAAARQRMEAQP